VSLVNFQAEVRPEAKRRSAVVVAGTFIVFVVLKKE
jgi:hypothetical protein